MKKRICLLIIAFLVVTNIQPAIQLTQAVQATPTTITNTGTINHSKIAVGVNYLSTYHLYSPKYTTDEILNRDLARFKQDGISTISINLYWYRLEGNTRGDFNGTTPDGSVYGDSFLENVKHIITMANQYGIKVLVTFHTLWGEDSPWCTPDYVIDPYTGKNIGLAVVRSEQMRQAFIDMVNHTVSHLAGTQGIWAWAILNEPWYWGMTSDQHDFLTDNSNTQKENFLTLFQQLANIVKEEDGRYVTIRFSNAKIWIGTDENLHIKNIFNSDWGYDDRIFAALDFIGLNAYMPVNSVIQTQWTEITKDNIQQIALHGAKTWITECGIGYDAELISKATYSNAYATMISNLKSMQIEGAIAWCWRGDYVPPGYDENPAPFGSLYNLCSDSKGIPSEEYYDLLSLK